MGLFSSLKKAVKQVAHVATDSAAFFTGGTSGVNVAHGKAPTAKTVATDLAGLTAGQSIAGAALPGFTLISGGARYAIKSLEAVDAAGNPAPLDGHQFGAIVPLNFGANQAGLPAGSPPADKVPASPPVMAPQPQLAAWLVLGAALFFIVKG